MLPLALLLALKIAPPATDVVYRQPQIASTGDMVGLTFGSGNEIFYTYSKNDGQTFARPARIDTGGKLSLGRHRGPRLVYQGGNAVISAVVGKKGGGADGDLMAWRSNDNGTTWMEPVRVNDVPGSAREGLHAMANGNGWVVAVWLDLREKGTKLYGARSDNGGATWTKNFPIYDSPDGSICQCCHPTVAVGPAGVIHVMWRNALAGSRDMYTAKSENGGKTFSAAKKLGKETWVLDACPMDGGGFAITAGNKLYSIWRRGKTVYYAGVDGNESELGFGKDAAIASGLNDSLYAVWSAPEGIKYRTSKGNKIETLSAKGEYPQVIFTGRSALAFWEEDGGIAMGTVEAPAPLLSKPSR